MNTTFNYKKYGSRAIFWAQAMVALFAILACLILCASGNVLGGLVVLAVAGVTLNRPKARCCAVTLSVPEILTDVMDAFKLETPMLFQPGGFGTDLSSKTAVLGDKITAKIAHVPTVGTYDKNNGGFKAAQQDVTTLIEDVPVTLDQFKVVVINVPWLTQLASKLDLYKEAIRNYGYALGKYMVDYALMSITPANFSNTVVVPLANVNLDTFDDNVRSQLNTQKASGRGRYSLINTACASRFGTDDRVRSALFYNSRNGDDGFRVWNNIAGLKQLREYPDMYAAGNLIGFAGDARAIAVATRRIDYSNAAEQLGVPKVMEFYPMSDADSGVEMTGVAWQESGTGDVFIGAGVLFGVGAGKQGGNNGTITDNAGVRIVTA